MLALCAGKTTEIERRANIATQPSASQPARPPPAKAVGGKKKEKKKCARTILTGVLVHTVAEGEQVAGGLVGICPAGNLLDRLRVCVGAGDRANAGRTRSGLPVRR